MTSSEEKTAKFHQMLQEMRQDYLQVLPARIAKIRKLTDQGDWKSVNDEYHKLKGTGKTYGFAEISTLCKILESLSMNPPVNDVQLFNDAVHLLERMHQTYLKNQPFLLENDEVARRILALK